MATTDDAPEKPTKPRRRLPASARVGLLILALAALLWGDRLWLAWRINELAEAGNYRPDRVRLGPSWMRTKLGDRIVTWFYAKPTSLVFDGATYEDQWYHRLNLVPGLTHLIFRKSSFGDEGLRHVEPHPQLWWLEFFDCPGITDAALPRIAKLKMLRVLSLQGTSVTDAGLSALVGLPRLESVDLEDTAVTDDGMAEIARIPNLQTVSLGSKAGPGYARLIGARGLRELARRPGMVSIQLSNIEMTDEVVETLLSFPDLEQIWLTCPHATSDEVRRVTRLPNVSRLYRLGPSVGDEIVDSLLELKSLDWLGLDGTRITDAGLSRLAVAPNLTWLSLNDTQITAAGVAAFKGNRKLVKLDLDDTPVGDEIFDLLLALPALTSAGLAGTRVTDAGILRIAKHPTLLSLDLSRTKVTPAGVAALIGAMPTLQGIGLDDVPLVDADLNAFIAARGTRPFAMNLQLRRTGVSQAAAQRVAKIVAEYNEYVDWEAKP